MIAASGYRWVPASGELIFEPRRSVARQEPAMAMVPPTLTKPMPEAVVLN
jgi:hypothetical protein